MGEDQCQSRESTKTFLATALQQSSKNNLLLAEILHKGIFSDQIHLSDEQILPLFVEFTKNVCAVNNAILSQYTAADARATVNSSACVQPNKGPMESIELCHKPSLPKYVNNSDGTNCNDNAHKLSACQWVSGGIAETTGTDDVSSINSEDSCKSSTYS